MSDSSLMKVANALTAQNSFTVYNHMELTLLEADHAVYRLKIRPESHNPYGMVHGAALYAMADNAAGFAAHTDGRDYVTIDSSIHFISNIAEGVVLADARVLHRGHTTCLVDVQITSDTGKLLAVCSLTFFCIDRSRLQEKPEQH